MGNPTAPLDLTLSDPERLSSRLPMLQTFTSQKEEQFGNKQMLDTDGKSHMCHWIWSWVTLKGQIQLRCASCAKFSIVVPTAVTKQIVKVHGPLFLNCFHSTYFFISKYGKATPVFPEKKTWFPGRSGNSTSGTGVGCRLNTHRFAAVWEHPIQHFPSVDHRRKGTLSASALLSCDISRYHRIHARQWPIGGCDMHDTKVS